MSAYNYGHGDAGGPLSPRRRMPQPPTLLTTSLNNAAHLQHGMAAPGTQVPMSATSLSSPFSLAAASSSANGSPMASYNPQQWAGGNPSDQYLHAPGQTIGQTVRYAPRLQGPDEPVRSPPPPYSSQPVDSSPADSMPSNQFSPQYVPSSASTTMSQMWASENASPQTPYTRTQISPRMYPDPPARPAAMESDFTSLPVAPPASRRAASTGDMYRTQPARSPLAVQSETSGPPRHGIALPPPPPGPPPRGTRSISLSRAGESPAVTSAAQLAPRTRRPPALGTELGPVPPTPANWDENAPDPLVPQEQAEEFNRGPEALHVRTDGLGGQAVEEDISGSSSGGPSSSNHVRRDSNSALVRSPAVRNRSSSALRDRRTASRAGKRNDGEDMSSPVDSQLAQPLDRLVLNKTSTLAERRRSMRLSPRSGGSFQNIDASLGSGRSLPTSARVFASPPTSARSNIIEQIVEQDSREDSSTPTPSNQARKTSSMGDQPALLVSPRAPLSASAQSLLAPMTPRSAPIRPVSHLLHLPNDDEELRSQPILSPESTHSLLDFQNEPSPRARVPQVSNSFVADSLERHRKFAEKEAAAATDSDRLQIFVQYMQEESKIRREKYSQVFDQERIKPSDLTSKLFVSRAVLPEPPQSAPLPGRSSSILGSDRRQSTSSSGTSFNDSPQIRSRASTDVVPEQQLLKLDTSPETVRRREGAFVPALSPIASMSAVTGRDEMESRGRAPSRWWEEGSNSSGRGFDVMSRSKRESKYMSALIETDMYGNDDGGGPSAAPPGYDGPNGFPDEKAALKAGLAPQSPYNVPKRPPFENRPGVLDVSRFTTLPPPFPRHHPAVNNSHPDLADTRAILRTLNDVAEAETAKEEFDAQATQKRSRADSWAAHQQSIHEQEMQFRINQNDITRQEFDDANFALQDKVHNTKKSAIQSSFDLYQSLVVTPVHGFYSTRIAIANNTIDTLTNRLIERSGTPLPDQTQTEGDSQPELLERLTLLKWLFEARESLHKAQFDVLSKRNELYKELVLLPYSAPGAADNPANRGKAAEAAKFFENDYATRERELVSASLARWTALHDTIRAAVNTGVQSQLSAFWDIAPQIQDLLQQISSSTGIRDMSRGIAGVKGLENLEILIPRHEVDENSSYWEHPLRYLYSVMSHAEASTRQFVEAQVSLWCLEQEIREGFVRARAKADGHATQSDVDRELRKGVDDLKEKVEVVESQWAEGLGSEFESVKMAVRDHLEAMGGWDEDLQEMT